MMYQNMGIIALLITVYSLIAGKIEKGPISGPIVFLLTGYALGKYALGLLNVEIGGESYKVLAELALAMVLFTDASKTNFKVLQNNLSLPTKLLLIGLPITIAVGTLLGKMIFTDLSWVEAAILATVLAPTDAALGEPVVSNKLVPSKIREAINIESGLNDGICVPILFLLLILGANHNDEALSLSSGLLLFVKEIGIGAMVGITLAFLGDLFIKHGVKKDWVESAWKPTVIISLAISCFGFAQAFGGSGFIACFVGGLLFGKRYQVRKLEMLNGAEGMGKILSSVVWILFGCIVVGQLWDKMSWGVVLYALLSLSILRMLPVLLALVSSKLSFYEKIFTSWFGPRGLASIVFAVLVMDANLKHQETILATLSLTIVLSVLAHGFTATPMANAFRKNG